MTFQLKIDQVTIVNGCIQTENLNARIQILMKAYPAIDFHWTPLIRNVFIAPVHILMPKNKPFIYIAFDHKLWQDNRIETTTHFRQLISRN